MTAAGEERSWRIGELAERTGTTPRTIRYYDEIGLPPLPAGRSKGKHRLYGPADEERLLDLVRLRDLLGLSLDELRALVEAEDARAALRRAFRASEDAAERRRILEQARGHIDAQLALLRGRRQAIAQVEGELEGRRERIQALLAETDAPAAATPPVARPPSA